MRRTIKSFNMADEIASLGIKQAGIEFGKAFIAGLAFWSAILVSGLYF
jgi:hypothetical protein